MITGWRSMVFAAVCAWALGLAGCHGYRGGMTELPTFGSQGGWARIESTDPNGSILNAKFDTAVYTSDGPNTMTILLVEGPLDNPRQAVTIHMFYLPISGYTPLDATATNSVVRYVVFSDDASTDAKVGVYSGAGFVHPKQTPGKKKVDVSAWNATLTLADASVGFNDVLGRSQFRGRFTLLKDNGATNDGVRKISQLVSERLGYPRSVRADDPQTPCDATPSRLAAR